MLLSIKFYGPFNYSLFPIILVIFLIIFILLFNKKKKTSVSEKKEQVIIKSKVVDKNLIKNKYLKELLDLENDVNNQKVHNKNAYYRISRIIREFVYETTGIDVRKYTLNEIEKDKFLSLYELILEYYEPEFSYNTTGDIKLSIRKTKEVIEKWK